MRRSAARRFTVFGCLIVLAVTFGSPLCLVWLSEGKLSSKPKADYFLGLSMIADRAGWSRKREEWNYDAWLIRRGDVEWKVKGLTETDRADLQAHLIAETGPVDRGVGSNGDVIYIVKEQRADQLGESIRRWQSGRTNLPMTVTKKP